MKNKSNNHNKVNKIKRKRKKEIGSFRQYKQLFSFKKFDFPVQFATFWQKHFKFLYYKSRGNVFFHYFFYILIFLKVFFILTLFVLRSLTLTHSLEWAVKLSLLKVGFLLIKSFFASASRKNMFQVQRLFEYCIPPKSTGIFKNLFNI